MSVCWQTSAQKSAHDAGTLSQTPEHVSGFTRTRSVSSENSRDLLLFCSLLRAFFFFFFNLNSVSEPVKLMFTVL